MCSGKTTQANLLRDRLGARVIYVRDLLRERGAAADRSSLQEIGSRLETSTRGAWLAQAAAEVIRTYPGLVVLDSVRTLRQLERLRNIPTQSVLIYLTASRAALTRRFNQRVAQGSIEPDSYALATAHKTERDVEAIAPFADGLIDTTSTNPRQVFRRVRRFIR